MVPLLAMSFHAMQQPGTPLFVLAMMLGNANGAERDRMQVVAPHLQDSRIVEAVGVSTTAALVADAELCRALSGDLPVIFWVSGEVLQGRREWPTADVYLVPSVDGVRTALRNGVSRSRVHVIAHPIADVGAVFNTTDRGSVGLIAHSDVEAPLRELLQRCSAVSSVEHIPPMPPRPDSAFWQGPGAHIDHLDVVLFAATSTSGAVPALLMSRGLPLVAWDVGAAADAIVPGLCGWLASPRDPREVVKTVQHVLSDRWARESAGVAARDRILARHAPSAVAAAISSALAGVSKSNPRVRHEGAVGAG